MSLTKIYCDKTVKTFGINQLGDKIPICTYTIYKCLNFSLGNFKKTKLRNNVCISSISTVIINLP